MLVTITFCLCYVCTILSREIKRKAAKLLLLCFDFEKGKGPKSCDRDKKWNISMEICIWENKKEKILLQRVIWWSLNDSVYNIALGWRSLSLLNLFIELYAIKKSQLGYLTIQGHLP